jgi:hypothetical protein
MLFVEAENKIVRQAVSKFLNDPESRTHLDMRVSDFDGACQHWRSGQHWSG